MNPLSIAVNDFLVVSFTNNAKTTPQLITVVTASTVNGQKSYAVTAGGTVYTCTASNTVILEKTANSGGVATWVLGA